jgi:hypothetical protein
MRRGIIAVNSGYAKDLENMIYFLVDVVKRRQDRREASYRCG